MKLILGISIFSLLIASCALQQPTVLAFNNEPSKEAQLEKGCDQGFMDYCNNLGLAKSHSGDTEEAQRLFKNACDNDYFVSCFNLGYEKDKLHDFKEALRFYGIACDHGMPGACYHLGTVHIEQGNRSEALKLYRQACDAHIEDSCQRLWKAERSDPKDPQCIDTQLMENRIVIVQKLSDHLYEVRSEEGDFRMLLKTKRATYISSGIPLGLRVRTTGNILHLPMNNGFTRAYGELQECGISPIIPFDAVHEMLAHQHNMVFRSRLKEDRE